MRDRIRNAWAVLSGKPVCTCKHFYVDSVSAPPGPYITQTPILTFANPHLGNNVTP
jgi:hypothetical protein